MFSITDLLPGDSKSVLSLIWTYYASTLSVTGCPDHVLAVYHKHLPVLPWDEFKPDLHDLELMIQVCQTFRLDW